MILEIRLELSMNNCYDENGKSQKVNIQEKLCVCTCCELFFFFFCYVLSNVGDLGKKQAAKILITSLG